MCVNVCVFLSVFYKLLQIIINHYYYYKSAKFLIQSEVLAARLDDLQGSGFESVSGADGLIGLDDISPRIGFSRDPSSGTRANLRDVVVPSSLFEFKP